MAYHRRHVPKFGHAPLQSEVIDTEAYDPNERICPRRACAFEEGGVEWFTRRPSLHTANIGSGDDLFFISVALVSLGLAALLLLAHLP